MKECSLPPRHAIPSFWQDEPKKTYLHLGENPFPLTPGVMLAITQASMNINRYPDTNALLAREKIAAYVGNGVETKNVILGNGSDELIDLAVVSFCEKGQQVVTFTPSFFVYAFAAERHQVKVSSVPRNTDFSLPDPRELSVRESANLTFISNPNNPTGTRSSREQIINYLQILPGIIVVDECYYEFSGETVVDLIHKYKNLVVFRSLSKCFGLAGLRIGYAVAHEELIDILSRYALTFPVNAIAQAAAVAALEDRGIYMERVQRLIGFRNELSDQLKILGLTVFPSYTNFLLTLWPDNLLENPAVSLEKRGILVSDQTKTVGSTQPALRIGIGNHDQNLKLLMAVKEILPSQ